MVSFKSTLVVLFILLLGAGKAMASEEADYTLMLKEGDFEL